MEIEKLKPGDNHYKAYVGPPLKYDLVGAMQFNLLTSCGLRDYHKLLDIGCGSLRSGKLMIPYLQKSNYYGLEPNNWLIEEGIKHELGEEIISIKSPSFSNSSNFELQTFNEKFDFIIAQSIFSHASAKQISKCLKESKIVLKKEGVFLATFVLGKDNYRGEEWVYPTCVQYNHKFILELAKQENLLAKKTKWHHPNGQTWYIFYHPENESKIQEINKNLFTTNKSKFSFVNFARNSELLNNRFTKSIYKILKK